MFFIIPFLDFPSSVGFFDSIFHRIYHHICIHDNVPITVSGCTADGLDQRGFGTEKALAI